MTAECGAVLVNFPAKRVWGRRHLGIHILVGQESWSWYVADSTGDDQLGLLIRPYDRESTCCSKPLD